MQIQQQIMLELADIPKPKLFELYDLIHYFKLGLIHEKKQPNQNLTGKDKLKKYEAIKKVCEEDA